MDAERLMATTPPTRRLLTPGGAASRSYSPLHAEQRQKPRSVLYRRPLVGRDEVAPFIYRLTDYLPKPCLKPCKVFKAFNLARQSSPWNVPLRVGQ